MPEQSDFSSDMKMLKQHFGDGPSIRDDEEELSAALKFYREASEATVQAPSTPAPEQTEQWVISKQPKVLTVAKESIPLTGGTKETLPVVKLSDEPTASKQSKTGKDGQSEPINVQAVPPHLQSTQKALDLLNSKASQPETIPIVFAAGKLPSANSAENTLTASTASSYKVQPAPPMTLLPIQGAPTKEKKDSPIESNATIPILYSPVSAPLKPALSAHFENTNVGSVEQVKQPAKEATSPIASILSPVGKSSDSAEKTTAKISDPLRSTPSTREADATVANNTQASTNAPKAPVLEQRNGPVTLPDAKTSTIGNLPSVQAASSLPDLRALVQSASSLTDAKPANQLELQVPTQILSSQSTVREGQQAVNQSDVRSTGRAQSDTSIVVPTNVTKAESRANSMDTNATPADNSVAQNRREWKEIDQIKLIALPIKMPEAIKVSDESVKSPATPKDSLAVATSSAVRPEEIRRHFVYQDEVRTDIIGSPRTLATTKEVLTVKEVSTGEKGSVANAEPRPIVRTEERGDKQQLTPMPVAIKDGYIADREGLREPSFKPSKTIQETVKIEEIKITKSTMVGGTAENDAFIPWFFLTPRTTERSDAKQPEKTKITRKTTRTEVQSSRRTSYLVQEGDTVESIAIRQLGDIRYAGLLITINRSIFHFIELKGRMEPQLRPFQMIWLPSEAERTNYSKAIFTNKSTQSIPLETVSEQAPRDIDLPEVAIMNALHTVLQGIRLSGGRQPVSLRDLEAKLAPATKPSKMAAEVNAIINRLADSARIITKLDSAESFNCELQLLNDGNWKTVIAYEYQRGAGKRYSCYNDGFRRPFDMDLPVSIVREMANEDFQRNWSTYCNDFIYSQRQHRAS